MLFPSTLEQASTQHRLKNVTLCLQTEWAKITVWAEGFPTQIWEEGFAFPGWSSGLGLQLALFAGVLWEISYCRNSHFFFLYRAFFPQWKNSLLSRRAVDVHFANTHLNISSRKFSSVQLLSRVRLFATPWTAARKASLSITNSQSLLKLMSIELVMPSCNLILCCSLLLLPSVFPASGSFPLNQFFTSGGQRIGVSASASVLPMNIQDWFPLGLTGLISLCPRNTEESSPVPQLKSINSSTLSFLYSPNLTSIQDNYKTHSFDLMDLRWQSNISAF